MPLYRSIFLSTDSASGLTRALPFRDVVCLCSLTDLLWLWWRKLVFLALSADSRHADRSRRGRTCRRYREKQDPGQDFAAGDSKHECDRRQAVTDAALPLLLPQFTSSSPTASFRLVCIGADARFARASVMLASVSEPDEISTHQRVCHRSLRRCNRLYRANDVLTFNVSNSGRRGSSGEFCGGRLSPRTSATDRQSPPPSRLMMLCSRAQTGLVEPTPIAAEATCLLHAYARNRVSFPQLDLATSR